MRGINCDTFAIVKMPILYENIVNKWSMIDRIMKMYYYIAKFGIIMAICY